MMMAESYVMDTIDLDEEIIYSEKEIDAIYREYQDRVVKKYEFRALLKKVGVI